MMIKPVSPVRSVRPLEALRQTSEQIRRAAEILADITADTADLELPSARPPLAGDEYAATNEATIRKAQRSFAARLRVAQEQDDATS